MRRGRYRFGKVARLLQRFCCPLNAKAACRENVELPQATLGLPSDAWGERVLPSLVWTGEDHYSDRYAAWSLRESLRRDSCVQSEC